jgi:choline dehydrogenase-like flavoprotein
MPAIPAGNPHTTIVMIAERAAEGLASILTWDERPLF